MTAETANLGSTATTFRAEGHTLRRSRWGRAPLRKAGIHLTARGGAATRGARVPRTELVHGKPGSCLRVASTAGLLHTACRAVGGRKKAH